MIGSHHRFDEHDEPIALHDSVEVEELGDYLRVRCGPDPVYIYRLLRPGETIHPATDRVQRGRKVYKLAWIEDDKEHGSPGYASA